MDPRREKLLDYRRHSKLKMHIIYLRPFTRRWFRRQSEKRLRQEWRREQPEFTKFTHRHRADWDIT